MKPFLFLFSVFLGVTALAAPTQFTMPHISKAPVIDGMINENEYKNAVKLYGVNA